MVVFFALLTLVVVVAIGLVAVGGVTARLAGQPPPSLFDVDEAVDYVAERLPYAVSAELSYEDVRQLVEWHLEYLEAKGMAGASETVVAAVPEAGADPVVAHDDEGVAFVLGKAGEAGLEVSDDHIVHVIETEMAYLTAIGAIGSVVLPQVDVPPTADAG